MKTKGVVRFEIGIWIWRFLGAWFLFVFAFAFVFRDSGFCMACSVYIRLDWVI